MILKITDFSALRNDNNMCSNVNRQFRLRVSNQNKMISGTSNKFRRTIPPPQKTHTNTQDNNNFVIMTVFFRALFRRNAVDVIVSQTKVASSLYCAAIIQRTNQTTPDYTFKLNMIKHRVHMLLLSFVFIKLKGPSSTRIIFPAQCNAKVIILN